VKGPRVSCKEGRIWKGEAIRRRLKPGSRGIAIVRSRYQATTNEGAAGWKNLACAVANCKVWKLALAL
jgi:hypothetical protein